jgi:hypothetical protein
MQNAPMLGRKIPMVPATLPTAELPTWSFEKLSLQEISLASSAVLLIAVLIYLSNRQQRHRNAELTRVGGVTMLRHKLLTSGAPCARCHYLTQNPYLPCAVNPQIVATPEAIGCSDFRRKGYDFSSKFYLEAVNRKQQLRSPEMAKSSLDVNRRIYSGS